MTKKDEMNTKRTTKWAINTLKDFLSQKQMDSNFANYTVDLLNETLWEFYAAVQSTKAKGGGEYSVASLRCLRAGINRHLPAFNIVSDVRFQSSNVVFTLIVKSYRKRGKDTSVHHPRISESDLESLRNSPSLSPDKPRGLVRKVWFDVQLCLVRRNRELSVASFILQRDEDGVEYISLAHNPQTKNHKDPNDPDKEKKEVLCLPGPDIRCVQSKVSRHTLPNVHRMRNHSTSTQSVPRWRPTYGTAGSRWVSTTLETC